MSSILFLVLHRKDRSPGQRYRHEQYIEYFKKQGIKCTFSPLMTEKDDVLFYQSGNKIAKVWIGFKSLLKRLKDIARANRYDYIYIYRDAFFFGSFVEKLICKRNSNVVFDFDDAIWLSDENPAHGFLNRLKNPDKTGAIVSMSSKVIVGNEYLAKYAQKFCNDISIIPSTIDTKFYTVHEKKAKTHVCIGWTGSFSTIKHFESILPALEVIKKKYKDKVYFKLIGDPSYSNPALEIQGIKWQSKTEVSDLSELDIGIMPLPDNKWTKGKCGMKGLQYMALEIPTIMSPVGVNSDIIKDGKNGFLAGSTEEWIDKISQLIDDSELRQKLGKEGRKTVEKEYSVEANKDKWLKVFQS